MIIVTVLGLARGVSHPAQCGPDAYCANKTALDWLCITDYTLCRDTNHVMLHMRVDNTVNTTNTPCIVDTDCNAQKCVARQCHTVPAGQTNQFQVAAAACASLGPEFTAEVTNDDGSVNVNCTGGNWALLDADERQAYSCALCAGYAARKWDSQAWVTGPLSCRLGGNQTDGEALCNSLYGGSTTSNMLLARESTYELEAIPSMESYLLVGILPTALEMQMWPHTITVPLKTINNKAYYKSRPPQLLRWDNNLRSTENDLALLWRFVTYPGPADAEHVFGKNELTTHNGSTVPAAIPESLCTIIPTYRVNNNAEITPDPYCCTTLNDHGAMSGCSAFVSNTYGLNHFYMRSESVCDIVSAIPNPLRSADFVRKIPPYADFLVVPQRWTETTHGSAVESAVTDVDRTKWNNGQACRPQQGHDWCLRRDYGVTSSAGECVRRNREPKRLVTICEEDGYLNIDCIGTVDPAYYAEMTTTVTTVHHPRPRCTGSECTVGATGCPHTYGRSRYRVVENVTWEYTLPSWLDGTNICRHICDISEKCVAFAASYGNTRCIHWSEEAIDIVGDGVEVTTKTPVENGCYTVQYDADVSGALFRAKDQNGVHIYNVNLATCYRLCEKHNCLHLVYNGLTNECGVNVDLNLLEVNSTGEGLYAQRSNLSCVCPSGPSTTSTTTTTATTATMTGFGNKRALFGIAKRGKQYACGPSAEWICPVYASCRESPETCQPFELTAALSNTTYYYSPTELPRCTGITSSANPPLDCGQIIVDVAPTTAEPAAGVGYASGPGLPSVGPTTPPNEIPLVEIVVASVTGGCGLILIAAGFYYRKKLSAAITSDTNVF